MVEIRDIKRDIEDKEEQDRILKRFLGRERI